MDDGTAGDAFTGNAGSKRKILIGGSGSRMDQLCRVLHRTGTGAGQEGFFRPGFLAGGKGTDHDTGNGRYLHTAVDF